MSRAGVDADCDRLGATAKAFARSARSEFRGLWDFPVLVAAVSSLFGVRRCLQDSRHEPLGQCLKCLYPAAMILLLCVIECVYMSVVKRSSDQYLLTLMQPQREE